MIKNIILDIGDVLVRSNYHEFFKSKGYDEETACRLEKATFFTPVWKELDRGVWSFAEIIEGFVKNAPELEAELRSVFCDMDSFIVIYPYAVEWIKEMKRSGLNVYCLSNISDKICRDCEKEFEFIKYTDGYVFSYEERLIKPDPAIYERLLEKYNLNAEECIFIDDIEANVAAAQKLGIHGIVFREHQQAKAEIEEIRRSEK